MVVEERFWSKCNSRSGRVSSTFIREPYEITGLDRVVKSWIKTECKGKWFKIATDPPLFLLVNELTHKTVIRKNYFSFGKVLKKKSKVTSTYIN